MNHGSAAVLEGTPRTAPRHETVVAALEAAAADGAPFITLHGQKDGPLPLDARAALEGASRWASVLMQRGVTRGDRVLLLLPTGEAFVTALLGTMLCGAAPVPLAMPMTFGSMAPFLRNLAAILANADPKVLVTHQRVVDALAAADMNRPELVVLTDKDRPAVLGPTPTRWPSVGASDTALVQYTSGTTGNPKGVVISHRALVANTKAISEGLSIGPGEVGGSWLPMFHDMGLVGVLLTAVCHPYPVHIMSPERFAMGPQRWLHMLATTGATRTVAPNFAYEMAASRVDLVEEGTKLDKLRLALCGAEPVQLPTVRRFEQAMARFGMPSGVILPVYGMAECTLAVTFSKPFAPAHGVAVDRDAFERHEVCAPRPDVSLQEITSVGVPVRATKVAVVSEDGQGLPEDRVGRIRVASDSLMDGYFRNDVATSAALKDGWLDTGDLGFIHDGQLFVAGRADDVIIQGGRNVHPADVERVAIEVSGLRPGGVVAFGASSSSKGTQDIVVVAETAVRDKTEQDRMAREIRGEVLAALGVRVDAVHLWPVGAVPRTTSGKARRKDCARRVSESKVDPSP
jgi:acyl-CoA synthetase (AMP-forming)/AMP-acid ligase II